MILRLIFTATLLFKLSTGFSQEQLLLKQTRLSEAMAFEKAINPAVKFSVKNITLSEDYYPLADKYRVALPIVIERQGTDHLPLNAEYYYTPKDSILRLISYDWEVARYGNLFDKQKIWKDERSKLQYYNGEYERIKGIVLARLGNTTINDDTLKEVTQDGQNISEEMPNGTTSLLMPACL